MSSILKHKSKNPDKNVSVKAKSVSRKEAGFGEEKKEVVNFDVSVRMNNHTRNALLTLAKIKGSNVSSSSVISDLVDQYVEKMSPQDFKIYKEILNTFELKDELSAKLKSK